MSGIFIKQEMSGFLYGHFFCAPKPVSLRTAAYVGKYNARRLYYGGLITAVRLPFGVVGYSARALLSLLFIRLLNKSPVLEVNLLSYLVSFVWFCDARIVIGGILPIIKFGVQKRKAGLIIDWKFY